MKKPAQLLAGLIFAFSVVWLPLTANAQQPEKMHRVGLLGSYSPTSPLYKEFRQGLHELGYIEGKNIIIEERYARGDMDRLPELARELAGLNVEVMFVGGDQALRAAKEATNTIPIVVSACDPLNSLVASIARPGGKATGLTCISSDLATKRLQVLKELVPALSRVAVLYNPEDHNKAFEYTEVQEAARSLNLIVHPFEARSASGIDEAFAAIVEDHRQGILILSDAMMVFNEKKLAELTLQNKLPAIFGFREFADFGGLVSYGANLRRQYRRAAWYVSKIVAGTDPGDLPIEQPTRFELVINLKAARTLGLSIPEPFLASADEVIE